MEANNNLIKRAYIEIQVLTDNAEPTYDTFNLNPDIAIHFQVGDKWIIKRDRIEQSDFFENIICHDHRLMFYQREMSYFSSHSNICFIKIVERLFDEDCLELHGKVIPKDGEFYE